MYKIYLKEQLIGTTTLDRGDVPMGVVFGKIDFSIDFGYTQIKNYCLENNIELAMDFPKDRMISTMTISALRIVGDNGVEIKGEGNQISGMDSEGYEISIFGIPFPFYKTEFPYLVKKYEERFKNS